MSENSNELRIILNKRLDAFNDAFDERELQKELIDLVPVFFLECLDNLCDAKDKGASSASKRICMASSCVHKARSTTFWQTRLKAGELACAELQAIGLNAEVCEEEVEVESPGIGPHTRHELRIYVRIKS